MSRSGPQRIHHVTLTAIVPYVTNETYMGRHPPPRGSTIAWTAIEPKVPGSRVRS
jgi:hypothetical protein